MKIHRSALVVPDLGKALRKLEKDGLRLIDREPRVGTRQERIAFLPPASIAGVLIELMEEA